jgi:heme/copper-type cytochrome/quinol oxidase subunit 3
MIKKAARERDVPTIRMLMPMIIGVGVILLVIRGFEFNNLNCRWTDDAYSSIIWAILFLHTTHLITDWGDTIVLWALMMTDVGWEGRRLVDTDENSMYWRYVWLLWLPTYAVIYWVPRL